MNFLKDYSILLIVWMWFTYAFFLAVMHLRIVRDTVGFTKWNFLFAYSILVVGLVLDAILNLLMCIPLLDMPKEILLTAKFKRLIREDMGWRGDVAEFFCNQFLNPADKGHC
jgi:hypothetical protein